MGSSRDQIEVEVEIHMQLNRDQIEGEIIENVESDSQENRSL